MQERIAFVAMVTVALILSAGRPVDSQGLMGGFKGHRGSGAVELLLATGILAKLLNVHKRGGFGQGRAVLQALIGGPRYPSRYQGRYPLGEGPLLQDDLIEPHASMLMPFNDPELMLHEESALLAAKSPYLYGPMFTDGQLLAASEAQITQQLLTARQARKILAAREARKLLAAQEARSLLAAQRDAREILAAREATAILSGATQQVSASQTAEHRQMPAQSEQPRQLVMTPAEGHQLSRADEGTTIYAIKHHPDQLLDETLLLNLHHVI